jgi:hypothetical protein
MTGQLAVGFAVLVVLTVATPLRDTDGSHADARRVLLRAMLETLLLFAACCAWIAWQGFDGALGIWPGIVFVPGFLLFSLLIPLWTDSPAIRTDEPATGWIAIGSIRIFYSNAADDALWVHLSSQFPGDTLSILYTPNLGHRYGRVAMLTFVVLIATIFLLLVAASTARS